jgi:flagellar biosynthesis GTPase FlhF
MQILRFEGNDVQEALKRAQIALGPDALIVKTNMLQGSDASGYGVRRRVEVLALSDIGATACVHQPDPGRLPDLKVRTISLKPGVCTAIAMVGPPGAGKTTTIAKLAAAAHETGQILVAFLSIDDHRLGAADQLMAFSRQIGLPIMSVSTVDEVKSARQDYSTYDMLFIDTPGISASNSFMLSEQAEMLAAAGIDETHLCLPSTYNAATLEMALKQFSVLTPTQLLLTRWDESARCRDVIDLAVNSGIPLSYVTNGQEVPDDIVPASRELLEERLTSEETRMAGNQG